MALKTEMRFYFQKNLLERGRGGGGAAGPTEHTTLNQPSIKRCLLYMHTQDSKKVRCKGFDNSDSF